MNGLEKRSGNPVYKALIYIVLIILAILSLFPFYVMVINSTRSTTEIQQHAVSLIPSSFLGNNWNVLTGKTFNPYRGFINSVVIAVGCTVLTIYFSTLTAWAIVAYEWKLKKPFFTFILAVMMIPGTITAIGFYQFMWKIGLTNNYLALIIPAIAAPGTVFFMRQYMLSSFPMELLDSARIDGSGEFKTFNEIALPIMKPAIAVQAIFTFVSSWNNYFTPSLILHKDKAKTLPILIAQLRAADWLKFDMGQVYAMIAFSIFPVIIVYLILSKNIVGGVSAGAVKG
jgi:multiple sugar transport system permease protein